MIASKYASIGKTYSNKEFLELLKDVTAESIEKNSFYQRMVNQQDFKLENLNDAEDLYKIPAVPTPFYKESANLFRQLLKIPENSPEFKYWNVSSCTTGDPSLVGISVNDREILEELAKKCLLE